MSKCLVTKLNGVVNNPNLPIFEVMQQFTLDAIAASGNSSMNDEQKWALNHFFYQIGAIDNSGIYPNLTHIFLPMIALNVEKTLMNYKGNTDLYNSQDIVLSDGGISAISGTKEIGRFSFSPLTIADLTLISSVDELPSTATPFDSTAATADGNFQVSGNGTVTLTPIQTYNKSLIPSTPVGTKTLGLSCKGTTSSDISVYANDGTVTSLVSKLVQSDFRSIPNTNNSLRFRINENTKWYATILGNGITKAQLNTLVSAVADLRNAFIS